MKTFTKPYLKVINLEQKELSTEGCIFHCTCNIVSCTCDSVCDCVDDCVIDQVPSN